MSLTPLTWKQLPVQTLTAGYTAAQFLDAIYTAFSSSTYVNGSARALGAGVAWTFSKYQNSGVTEAVYGYPAGSNTIGQRVIFTGSATSPSPTPVVMPGYTYTVGNIHIGLAKNAGNFLTWNGAAPFTSGQFTGYTGFHARQSTVNIQIRIYESQDAVVCIVNSATTTASCWAMAGGLIDPETGDNSSDAESDGKLYACGGSQTQSGFVANIGSPGFSSAGSSTTNTFAHQYNSSIQNNYNNKFVCFTPGGSALLGLARIVRYHAIGNALSSRTGKYVKIPMFLHITDSVSAFYTDPPLTFGGRLREIWITRNALGGTTLRNNSTDIGYFIGDSLNTVGGAYLLST